VSMARRLEILEEQARRQREAAPRPSGWARERMREHLDRLAGLRRSELDSEQAAEVEATDSAIRERLTALRGEGGP
jgi:hypothetical protein